MVRKIRPLPFALLCVIALLGCSSSGAHPTASQTRTSENVATETSSAIAPTATATTPASGPALSTISAAPTTTSAPTDPTGTSGTPSETTTSPEIGTNPAGTTPATTGTTPATTAPTTTAPQTTAAAGAGAGSIPTTSYAAASQQPAGAGPYPPGVSGERCPSTFLNFQDELTDNADDAAYAILAGGLSCASAGHLAVGYMQATSGSAASSQAPPASATVDGDSCGSYWYRPAGDHEEPLPFVTCLGPGTSMTVFGTGD